MTDQERIAQLEADLRAITDRVGGLMDQALQKDLQPVFRCSHSGLLLPSDYVREWGRKYGIGLGHSPVSEVLDSDYETDPPEVTNRLRSISQIMHPIGPCMAQMDFILVPRPTWDDGQAILDIDDPRMEDRAVIVREKQLINPRSRIRVVQTAYEKGR